MSLPFIMILILLFIGFASGALSGLVGVGGGIIIVPALVYFLAFSQKEAQGTSLGILILPVGILGVLQYYKQGQIDLRVVIIVSIGFLIGNFFGSKLSLSLSDAALKKIFAIILILIAIKILFIDSNKANTKRVAVSDIVEKHKKLL
jgi:uncharacterized membrane protein YfcA